MGDFNRFDIPETVKNILIRAIEIDLINIFDAVALGIKFGSDFDAMVEEIVEYGYATIHELDSKHGKIIEVVDEYYKEKFNK